LPIDPQAVRPKKQNKFAGHILLRASIKVSSNPVLKFGSGNLGTRLPCKHMGSMNEFCMKKPQ